VLKEFAQGGYYSVTMPAPMRNTRLVAVNDLFLSPEYRTCAGKPGTAAASVELKWLQETLAEARRLGQRVWVVGHIPPGVNPYATVAYRKDICGHEAPVMFLSSDKLAELLIEYSDVIRLGIFAHSHMDEMRLLDRESRDPHAAPVSSDEHSVAIKMVPSISPVDGNNPSFTVSHVNPATATLQNYEVMAASNAAGVATTWTLEYDYAHTYHQAQFSPSAVQRLIVGFAEDRDAKTEASKAYIRNFYVGDRSIELTPFWPQYICALANHTAKAFTACACAIGK
jgi:sphingomyelin phosphodiesterase acid-like 3